MHSLLITILLTLITPVILSATPLHPSQQVYITSITYQWDLIGSNQYTIQLSTDNFITAYISLTIQTNTTTFMELKGNTSYYFRVKISTEDDTSYLQNTLSTVTLTSPIEDLKITKNIYISDTYAKLFINFTSLNADDTLHQIIYSTDSSFNLDSSTQIFITGNPPFELEGLDTNTTYYIKIKPIDRQARPTSYSPVISTQTIAKLPDEINLEIYITSITLSWTPVDGEGKDGSSGYKILLTDDNDNPVFETIFQYPSTSSATITELSTNTIYRVIFSVLNSIAVENQEKYRLSTLSPPPQDIQLIYISSNTSRFSWTPISPQTDTNGYILEASTSSSFETTISSISENPSTSQLGINLLPNTTYYFRVGSLNQDFIPNYSIYPPTMTLTVPLDNSVIIYRAYPFNIKAEYERREPPTSPWGTYGYIFEVSTMPFTSGVVFSSYTPSNEINTLTISNLRPNQRYFTRVGTINGYGAINYSIPQSLTTPFPDINLDPYVMSYSSTALTVGYSTTASDGYILELSTDEFFATITASSATTDSQKDNLTVFDLTPDKLYYIRVGALFSGSTMYFSLADPLRTLTSPPQITDFKIYITSAVSSWDEVSNSQGYIFEASTDPYYTPKILNYTNYKQVTTLALASLKPNTSYYFRVGSLNSDGIANYTSITQTSTLANLPIEEKITSLTTYSMQINFLTNSNPSDTLYLVEISSTNFQDHPLSTKSSSTYNPYAYFDDLKPNTTYYIRVTAFNRHNIPTGPVNFTPLATLAYKVTNLTHITSTRTLILNWQDTLNAPGTPYLAEISSDGFNTIISSYTLLHSVTFYNLNGNTIYKARVSALNFSSIPSEYEMLTTTTPVEMPAITTPTFLNILLDGFTVQWDNNSNSTNTIYIVEASTKSDFSVIFKTIQTSHTILVYGNLNFDTYYYVRVKAKGINREESDYLNLGSVKTLYRAEMRIDHTKLNVLSIPFSYGLIEVTIPPYSLGSSVKLFIEPLTEADIPPSLSNAAKLVHTGYAARIYIIPKVLFNGPIFVKIPYKSLPQQTDPNKLVLARYDEKEGLWVPIRSKRSANYVLGETYGLSIFAIMELDPAQTIDNVKIYPNPYKPNTTPGYMTFSNLKPYSEIYIHTLSGELVKKLVANEGGLAEWDGRNSKGNDVASGVYVVVIKDNEGNKIVKKIGIEK